MDALHPLYFSTPATAPVQGNHETDPEKSCLEPQFGVARATPISGHGSKPRVSATPETTKIGNNSIPFNQIRSIRI